MSKSFQARVMSELLKFWPKVPEEETEQMMQEAFLEGEKLCLPPAFLNARYQDSKNGRMVYVNEDPEAPCVIFYIHGGAYRHDILLPHWLLIDKIARGAGAQVIVPIYRLVPFATYKESYDLIVPEYRKYAEKYPDKKIILMGDSAGGGFSLALAEYFRAEGIRMPDELVLISPWVDVTMENEEIEEYQPSDPFLYAPSLRVAGRYWAGDLDPHDPKVSPVYGDLKGINHVTVLIGTSDILYPDTVKCYQMLDEDPSNELIVAEGMNHVYPLFPIPEAKPAVEKIIQAVTR